MGLAYGTLPRMGSFVDDTRLCHPNVDTIVPDLHQLFGRAREAKLKFKLNKIFLGFQRLNFVGHTLSSESIGADEVKIQWVVGFQRPEDISQLPAFLELVGYYRRFVKAFGKIAQPLTKLLKNPSKTYKEQWGEARIKRLKD